MSTSQLANNYNKLCSVVGKLKNNSGTELCLPLSENAEKGDIMGINFIDDKSYLTPLNNISGNSWSNFISLGPTVNNLLFFNSLTKDDDAYYVTTKISGNSFPTYGFDPLTFGPSINRESLLISKIDSLTGKSLWNYLVDFNSDNADNEINDGGNVIVNNKNELYLIFIATRADETQYLTYKSDILNFVSPINLFILRLDPNNGDIIWSEIIGGSNSLIISFDNTIYQRNVASLRNGDIVIYGTFRGGTLLSTLTLNDPVNKQPFIISYDSNGNNVNKITFQSGTLTLNANANVIKEYDNELYICLTFRGSVVLDIEYLCSNPAAFSLLIFKLDSSLNLLPDVYFFDNTDNLLIIQSYSLSIDLSKNVYFSILYNKSFSIGSDVFAVTTSNEGSAILVLNNNQIYVTRYSFVDTLLDKFLEIYYSDFNDNKTLFFVYGNFVEEINLYGKKLIGNSSSRNLGLLNSLISQNNYIINNSYVLNTNIDGFTTANSFLINNNILAHIGFGFGDIDFISGNKTIGNTITFSPFIQKIVFDDPPKIIGILIESGKTGQTKCIQITGLITVAKKYQPLIVGTEYVIDLNLVSEIRPFQIGDTNYKLGLAISSSQIYLYGP